MVCRDSNTHLLTKAEEIDLRCQNEAKYIISTWDTIRSTAEQFGVCKSTVHRDMTESLLNVDVDLYAQVQEVLQYNKSVCTIRGGEATRNKWLTNGTK